MDTASEQLNIKTGSEREAQNLQRSRNTNILLKAIRRIDPSYQPPPPLPPDATMEQRIERLREARFRFKADLKRKNRERLSVVPSCETADPDEGQHADPIAAAVIERHNEHAKRVRPVRPYPGKGSDLSPYRGNESTPTGFREQLSLARDLTERAEQGDFDF